MKSNNRVETGAMRFGSDWTGTFVRGDDAYAYAAALRRILKKSADEIIGGALDKFDLAIIEGLAATLEGSSEDGWLPDLEDIQLMKEYQECSLDNSDEDDFELPIEEL